jgi:hypothetical protein
MRWCCSRRTRPRARTYGAWWVAPKLDYGSASGGCCSRSTRTPRRSSFSVCRLAGGPTAIEGRRSWRTRSLGSVPHRARWSLPHRRVNPAVSDASSVRAAPAFRWRHVESLHLASTNFLPSAESRKSRLAGWLIRHPKLVVCLDRRRERAGLVAIATASRARCGSLEERRSEC